MKYKKNYEHLSEIHFYKIIPTWTWSFSCILCFSRTSYRLLTYYFLPIFRCVLAVCPSNCPAFKSISHIHKIAYFQARIWILSWEETQTHAHTSRDTPTNPQNGISSPTFSIKVTRWSKEHTDSLARTCPLKHIQGQTQMCSQHQKAKLFVTEVKWYCKAVLR